MKIVVIHGPNLPLLGKVSSVNGNRLTLDKVNKALRREADAAGAELGIYQFHDEERMLKTIRRYRNEISGILLAPGALSQTAYALRELLGICDIPVSEVYIEEFPFSRESFDRSVLKKIACSRFIGPGIEPYYLGLHSLLK